MVEGGEQAAGFVAAGGGDDGAATGRAGVPAFGREAHDVGRVVVFDAFATDRAAGLADGQQPVREGIVAVLVAEQSGGVSERKDQLPPLAECVGGELDHQ